MTPVTKINWKIDDETDWEAYRNGLSIEFERWELENEMRMEEGSGEAFINDFVTRWVKVGQETVGTVTQTKNRGFTYSIQTRRSKKGRGFVGNGGLPKS